MKNRFYSARKNCGLTQQQVANILQVRDTAVSKWECGVTLPDGRMLKRISGLYGVTTDYLLELSDAEPELFDNARVERPEILELYESLTPELQAHALAYLHGLADRSAVQNSATVKIELDNRARKKQ